MPRSVDVAVVGLGLIGSGALRHLSAQDGTCLGIGPVEPPVFAAHTGAFASHYDSGRITRHLDSQWEWALLAQRAIAGYAQLEDASGISFHRPVGAVLAEVSAERIGSTLANAARMDVAVTVVEPGGPSPYGSLLAFPEGTTLLAEPGPAGHVDPRRMLAANLTVARAAGAVVVDDEVIAIDPVAGGWRLRARGGDEVQAGRVVLAAGPHADELAPGPRLEVRAETVVLATLGAAEQDRLAAMPSVLARMPHPVYDDLYVVPPTAYPDGTVRLKLGATRSTYLQLPTAEAKRAWMRGTDHTDELADLRALLEDLVPGLEAEAWETKPCLITETPSDLPYVDHLAPGLVLAAGGNGYAAKSANAIGALAATLAVEGRWTDPELDAAAFARQ